MDAERWQILKSLYGRVMDLPLTSRRAFAAGLGQPSLAADLGRLVDLEPTQFLEPVAHTSARAHVLNTGEVLQDRYEVRAFIGEGGMGEVYRAFDRFSNQEVAIKTLRGDLASDPVLASRLRRELQLARRVTHTNICRLHDIGRFRQQDDREVVFLSMELLRGETLCDLLTTRTLSIETAAGIASQLAEGLQAAHTAGIIHRDFKSANIFITHDTAGSLRAVISDFGVAQEASPLLGENATSFGLNAIVGTPAYMAPEQLEGKPVTTAADIYSFGVVLFEMVSGRLPVEGLSPVGIALQRIRQEAPDVRSLAPEVPKHWAMTIAACLEREPTQRPANAEVVRQMLCGEVHPPHPWVSRRAWMIGGGLGAAAAAAVAITAALEWPGYPVPPKAQRHLDLGHLFAKRRTEAGLQQAVAEFGNALQETPDLPEAYVGLADAYSAMANFSFINPKVGWTQARKAADTAARLDPHSGAAIGAQGYVTSIDLSRWTRAEPFFKEAVRISPKDTRVRLWYGAWLGKRGRSLQALSHIDAGLEIDPASFELLHQKAIELMHARRFADMLTQALEVVRLQPYEGEAHVILARAYEWSGDFDRARACCIRAESLGSAAVAKSQRGCIEAAAGNITEARQLADEICQLWRRTPFETLMLAQLLARTHPLSDVVAVLNEGYDRGDSTILGVPTSPYFDGWRKDSSFCRFIARLG